ncbi:MAG: tetratricopeptide repeat protein [Deltaproteobacteria bacterium]|nr:tetratricopeptide repeat protein [Deltaproteobacteria bacterium]
MRFFTTITTYTVVFAFWLVAGIGCGASEATQKDKKRSRHLYDTAHIAWDNGKGDVLLSIRNLVRSVEADPENDKAHYFLGVLFRGRDELEKSERHLRESLRLRQGATGGDRASVAMAQNALGAVLLDAKKFDEAEKLLLESLDEILNPSPWLPRSNLGLLYIETGEYDQAIAHLRRAVFDQPRFCEGLFRLSRAYYLKKSYPETEAMLKKTLEVAEPECEILHQDVYNLLGMTYLRMERDNDAKEAFDQCTKLGPKTNVGNLCAEVASGM